MAETYRRICLEERTFVDGDRQIVLKRGGEYLTSAEKDGQVRVFSTFWFWAPAALFAGERRFT